MSRSKWRQGFFIAFGVFLAWLAPAAAQFVGEEAPRFQATDLDGKPVDLRAVLGKQPVLLVFWASW